MKWQHHSFLLPLCDKRHWDFAVSGVDLFEANGHDGACWPVRFLSKNMHLRSIGDSKVSVSVNVVVCVYELLTLAPLGLARPVTVRLGRVGFTLARLPKDLGRSQRGSRTILLQIFFYYSRHSFCRLGVTSAVRPESEPLHCKSPC